MNRILNYIGGELIEPASGAYLDNVEPATGQVYSQVPDSDEHDVEEAVAAAENAFPAWSTMSTAERSRILVKIADLIDANLEELARAETIDNGKPLWLSRAVEIPRAAANMRFFATAILHTRSECHLTDSVALNYTLRKPRGVCGLISPWNLPLYLFTWKIAPAISVGNTAVAKPSEVTPMTAYLFSKLCIEAGLPPGVLNVVHGLGAKVGAAIVKHPTTTTLSFTGGTVTGREIARVANPMFKKVALEMGGKNPNIVFADAPEEAVAESVRAAFTNQGQVCLCGSRVFVERPIYDRFVERFVEETRKLKVGDPLEPDTRQGAVVSRVHLEKITSYVQLAREEGGTILCGGGRPATLSRRCEDGFFLEPTVIVDLPVDCRTNREEIFGPVVSITPFDTEDEVIACANGTDYGLSATVWTRDLNRAHRVADRIQSGTVWVNCWLLRDLRVPFGGMKQSGVGREGGDEALRFFTEAKNVCVKMQAG
ncbi:MAG: aldehyde dehydrogenase [Phycisphaerae bacterium]|nr:aldehyde dehydrogenase [Phycisphaerae bacterium]